MMLKIKLQLAGSVYVTVGYSIYRQLHPVTTYEAMIEIVEMNFATQKVQAFNR
jgi:hypothetical protein